MNKLTLCKPFNRVCGKSAHATAWMHNAARSSRNAFIRSITVHPTLSAALDASVASGSFPDRASAEEALLG